MPSLFYFEYQPIGGLPRAAFVSTSTGGLAFLGGTAGQPAWDEFMAPALVAYAEAWVADHPPPTAEGRSAPRSSPGILTRTRRGALQPGARGEAGFRVAVEAGPGSSLSLASG